jgi:hypothetical protein
MGPLLFFGAARTSETRCARSRWPLVSAVVVVNGASISRSSSLAFAPSLTHMLALVLALGACQPGSSLPLQNASAAGPDQTDEPIVDEAEWRLLHDVAREVPGGLEALATFYEGHGAWDEYSAVRVRLLDRAAPGSMPAPGGPFPRIGAPRAADARIPRTVLGRWVNRAVLPELFAAQELTLEALEKSLAEAVLTAAPGYEAGPQVRLGDVLCARLRFVEAAKHYDQALASRRPPYELARVRARRDDIRRILRPEADHLVGTDRDR